jgi:hypothetical protein
VTQGLVSIVDSTGATVAKIVVGDNGMNAQALADAIPRNRALSAFELYRLALRHDFGCRDCLIVQTRHGQHHDTDQIEEVPEVYREHFADPRWNPRWRHGTAEYTVVVELAGEVGRG